MITQPWWIYLVTVGIVFSAIMLVKSAKKEREIDLQLIEKEGEVYMKRIEEERARRKESVSHE